MKKMQRWKRNVTGRFKYSYNTDMSLVVECYHQGPRFEYQITDMVGVYDVADQPSWVFDRDVKYPIKKKI